MAEFKQLLPGIYRLEVPFSGTWTGVVLVRGEQNILIDSAAKAADVDEWIVPALEKLGLSLKDIAYLTCTHCHGDHVGGHARIRALQPDIKIACFEQSADKLRDPLKYNKLIRASFPKYSPAPSAGLTGVEPDVLLKDGEELVPGLRLFHTPGHDNDTVCFMEEKSRSLITGDSLQLNGTVTQGTGLVMNLEGYLWALERLQNMQIENIVAGHDYLPLGSFAQGTEKVKEYLDTCAGDIEEYTAFLKAEWEKGDRSAASLVRKLIVHINGVMPDFLFLPMYTVSQIMKKENLEVDFQ